LADIPILKQQLTAAINDIANLKMAMDDQFDTLSRTATAVGSHGMSINNLQSQSEMFRQKLVDVEVRTDNACTGMAEAKLVAQKSEAVAKKSMEVAQACSVEIKSLEKRMAALRKIQDDMVLNVSRIQDLPTQQQGVAPSRTDEVSENSIFLAGIPSIRDRLKMPPMSDPVFVVSIVGHRWRKKH
jgi:t-SNARE complex subunit (syntaxin)